VHCASSVENTNENKSLTALHTLFVCAWLCNAARSECPCRPDMSRYVAHPCTLSSLRNACATPRIAGLMPGPCQWVALAPRAAFEELCRQLSTALQQFRIALLRAVPAHPGQQQRALIHGSSLCVTRNVSGGCTGSRKVCSQVRHCGALSAGAFRHFSRHWPIPSKNLQPSGSPACAFCHNHSKSRSRRMRKHSQITCSSAVLLSSLFRPLSAYWCSAHA